MSGENPSADFNRDRAELFEALGHPTRIRILELLSDSPLGFSDMKKKLEVESSGLLQFHLGKLHGLVRIEEGNYTLTDDGREALRVLTVDKHEQTKARGRFSLKPLHVIATGLTIALIIAVAFGMYNNQQLNSGLTSLNHSYNDLNQQYLELSQKFNNLERLFWNNYPLTAPDYFIPNPQQLPTLPPISEAQALQIAIEYTNWASSLENVTVSLNLVCFYTYHNMGEGNFTLYGTSILSEIKSPVVNYSAIQVGDFIFRYLWIIDFLPPAHYGGHPCYVDAATGGIIPTGPVYDFSSNISPPISMLQAIAIGLNYGGWNSSSLEGMAVEASLRYMGFEETANSYSFWVISEVATPPSSYSAVQNGTITYRYVWYVIVHEEQYFQSIPPPGTCFIDAASGAIIPAGLIPAGPTQ